MGRNAGVELQRIVAAIGAYVDRAADDPTLSVSYAAIEQATGVSRGHLSRRNEPEIIALVGRIAAIKQARRSRDAQARPVAVDVAPAEISNTTHSALDALSVEALATIVRRDLQEVARIQQQWVARHARSVVQEAPLALYDLDDALRRLRAAGERLRPAVAEWTRRNGIMAGDTEGQDDQPTLDLEARPG